MTQANSSYSNFESNRWYYVSDDELPWINYTVDDRARPWSDYTNEIICDEISILDHYVNVWIRGWDICKPASKWSKYNITRAKYT